MKSAVEKALAPLVGLEWTSMTRASSMLMLGFGPTRRVKKLGGGTKLVSAYALHLQTPWRFELKGSALTGSLDVWLTAKGMDTKWDSKDPPRPSLFDRLIKQGFSTRRRRRVRECMGNACGDLRIEFTRGLAFSAFVNSGHDEESWRLLPPDESLRHFVVSPAGVVSK